MNLKQLIFDVNYIDEVYCRVGLLTQPLINIRLNRPLSPQEHQRRKYRIVWQWICLLNIVTESIRWFVMFCLSIWLDSGDPDYDYQIRKLVGDHTLAVGGISSYLHFTGFIYTLVCLIVGWQFFYGEHFDHDYLSWLDPILALKSTGNTVPFHMPVSIRTHLMKYWKHFIPLRLTFYYLVTMEVSSFLSLLMFVTCDFSSIIEILLTLLWSTKIHLFVFYLDGILCSMMMFMIMNCEYMRLRFKRINLRTGMIIKAINVNRSDEKIMNVFQNIRAEFSWISRKVVKHNRFLRVYIAIMYTTVVPCCCIPVFHVLHVKAHWMMQAALAVIGGFALPYLFINVFYFARVSATVMVFKIF